MKIIFCIHTPAQVHLFRNTIQILLKKGHKIKILARDYGSTLSLLDFYHLDYQVYMRHTEGHKFTKGFQIFPYVYSQYKLSRPFHPDLLVGVGTIEPITATLLHKPCILFNDSERTPGQHFINKTFADVIITPSCFDGSLGKKQYRIAGYKELAYLHPETFVPDETIYDELGLPSKERFVILRFNSFDAFHDIGKHGFSNRDRELLVNELGKFARVFISPEGDLDSNLKPFVLPVAKHRIHHALYYADLLVTDTQTMATEAAVLGTPVVRCNNWVGPNDMGIFKELEQKYDLIYSFRDPQEAFKKTTALISHSDLKELWKTKRNKLLADKINVTNFLVEYIENYPNQKLEDKKSKS